MAKSIAYIDSEYLERFMTDVFVGLGVPRKDAAICADVLITAGEIMLLFLILFRKDELERVVFHKVKNPA